MKNVEKTSNHSIKFGRLSLRCFEYVNTLSRSLSSQNTENQQITFAKYTVLRLCVRQNGRKKAVEQRVISVAKTVGCSRVIAHSLVRRFEQTVISIDP